MPDPFDAVVKVAAETPNVELRRQNPEKRGTDDHSPFTIGGRR